MRLRLMSSAGADTLHMRCARTFPFMALVFVSFSLLASSQAFGNTLLFQDSFDGSSLDPMWTTGGNSAGSSITVSNGALTIYGGTTPGGGRDIHTVNDQYAPTESTALLFQATVRVDQLSLAEGAAWGFQDTDANPFPTVTFQTHSTEGLFADVSYVGGVRTSPLIASVDPTVEHTYTILWEPLQATFWVDGSQVATLSTEGTVTPMHVWLDRGFGASMIVDDVRLESVPIPAPVPEPTTLSVVGALAALIRLRTGSRRA